MTSHLPSGKAGAAQLTRGQLRAALQAALTDAERRSLRAGDGAFCVNAFNRAVLLRLWDPGQDAPEAVDEGACRALAAEVYRDGIRVHILCPGAVHTRMAETVSRPDIDMNALIETEDIADAAEYLLTHRGNAVIDEIQMHRVGKQPF